MKTVDVLDKLRETNSRLEKEEIISEAWDNGCTEFFEGVQLAYDPLVVFNVKKVPEIKEDDPDFTPTFGWEDFKKLTNKLRTREITGHNARDALYDAASNADMRVWNEFMRRILLKDLRAGITDTTVNKILNKKAKSDPRAKEYLVNKFGCHLADKLKDGTEICGEYYVDQKLDGVRVITILDKNEGVKQLSRNGKQYENFTHIVEGLEKLLVDLPGSIVLDGEMTSRTFQELMTQVHRKDNVDASDSKYAIFDVVPLDEFNNGKSTKNQRERHDVLCNMIGMLQEYLGNKAYVVEKKLIDFGDKGEEPPEEFKQMLVDTVAAGYEGVIVKNPKGLYSTKRSKDWLKWKPTMTVDLEVVDVEIGTGRNSQRLGNLVCYGVEDGKEIYVSVGSGYSDEQREEFWQKRDSLKGQIVEIMADAITKDRSDDVYYSLRFPRFVRFRGFEKGEKL